MQTRNVGPSSFLTESNTNILLSPSERTGRKSYKLSNRKGGEKKEAVWPPHLEAALLDGLRKYRPISKSGRPLRRFTKRNVSISRHILATTGKSRTAKQVGSRLQQITESTKDAEIIRLITSRDVINEPHGSEDSQSIYSPVECTASESQYTSSTTIVNTPSSSVTASDAGSSELSICGEQVSLFAQLVHTELMSCVSYIGLDADITSTGINLYLSVDPAEGADSGSNSLYNARRLSNIPSSHLFNDIPTLSLSSPHLSLALTHMCFFSVYLDANSVIHSESTTLVPVPAEPSMGATYTTPLLPSYWEQFVRRASIERYTVILDILELEGGSNLEDGCRKFSIAINMKKDSPEEPILASCTTSYYYPPIEYPELPLATLATTPYLPDIPLQMSPSFQNGHTLSAWGDTGYHGLQSSFVQYPDLVDARFDTGLESDHSAYSYPSF